MLRGPDPLPLTRNSTQADILAHIYSNIMSGHFEIFNEGIRNSVTSIVACAVSIHMQVADAFVPSAIKFHYQWCVYVHACSLCHHVLLPTCIGK